MPMQVDIEGRLLLLRRYVDALVRLVGRSQEEFLEDFDGVGATKYFLMASMLCCIDLARGVIAARSLRIPRDFHEVFDVLGEAGFLDNDVVQALRQMDGLRYRLVQLYWDVDDTEVYAVVTGGLPTLRRFHELLQAL